MTRSYFVAGLAAIILAAALPVAAQVNIAVIDVQRVVTESDPGKQALQKLKAIQDGKIDEGRAKQQELAALQEQLSKQRFTLSEEKLAELSKQIEDKQIAMQRFQDDAERELEEARRRELGGLEARIIPVIDAVGAERGFTLIFNKFQSGLVYADDSVDITDDVIRRFNTTQ
ncbi:MAG: OmpH family outer membrane protein [Thermoanaerobaculales bacterium]|jgi:outer membrane protein|nr:OmpH family outer membrane protein [Thermoanaerobaculales bacterium]